ncbi:PREDICTED: AP2-like ethylene-responsive transcription factor At2g41710 isoform X1 [Theobroma cacao]|uniref:AP2-like ethylene-responsive transcription factor At2g41710 isoform X1 n=2 Tax=Theobroma cacao TaxID=3641 RepID=A0AB32V382_THECC|nr:PREDICTED: AP2-like ethylene-responsive transcription factor At2g41710 isoform X1 [Theobroma cacao]EOY09155.1 AP2 domain-containing transcription factor isoform 2 [Theobroma cacao]
MASTSSSDPGMKAEASGGENSETVIANDQLLLYRGLKKAKKERGCTAKERISKMPPCTAGKRSSIYRGVTRHRWTGRYEAHLWDKSTWNQNQNKKGKQVYLGAYDDEEAAARAYDLAALKYWGPGTLINFPVTDYTRDLEEMQNVSREDYLASLRRKSSGFSRGISKYRGLSSSRWDSSFGRVSGSEYFNSMQYSDDPATESDYIGGFCIERKIDLTGCIKWWGTNKTCQAEPGAKSSEEAKHACPEDIGSELKTSEWAVQPTEPYQMPCLGTSLEGTKRKGSSASALSILSRSADFKSLQERAVKKQENNADNDENENKNTINKMDHGKAAEKSVNHDTGSDRLGATLGMSAGLSLQKNVFPLTPFLSAPLLTNYNTIDSLVDPVLWTSLVPVLPTGPSRNPEASKTETSSTYTFFRPEG